MHKRGSVELWIFLVFTVIAFGGAVYVLLPDNSTSGMTSIRSTWGAAYVPIVPGPGDLHYNVLQCQAQCHGTAIETPRIQNPLERRGGGGLQQCLAWCRNQWRVAAEQLMPGKYDLDYIRVTQEQKPEINYPMHISGQTGIPRATRDNLIPEVPVSRYV